MSQILVFKNALLSELNVTEGVTKVADRPDIVEQILQEKNLGFMERKFAEDDPNYRQVIPYCVLRKGDLVFTYQRTKKGGENRLHDKWSLGVGGHFSKEEDGLYSSEAYKSSFIRELQEEVGLVGNYESKFLGIIVSNASEVDKVHCGFVYEINLLGDAKLEFHDNALDKGEFVCYSKLRERLANFESWSQLVIKELL